LDCQKPNLITVKKFVIGLGMAMKKIDPDFLRSDTSLRATAARLVAARLSLGLSQKEMAQRAGVSPSRLQNSEAARVFPARAVMAELFSHHRIDFNFIIYGDDSGLPHATRAAILAEFGAALAAVDRKAG
jgi:DNA-binding XRE family transcriptional regulator